MTRILSRVARPWAAAVAVVVAVIAGCAPPTASVTGTVTYEGEPVENGQITFTPANGHGAVAGGPIQKGGYSLKDVPPGPKLVRVEAYKKVVFAASTQEMMERAAEQKKKGNDSGLVDPADLIPANAAGNDQKVELTAGSNQKDFALTKPVGKKPAGK